MKLDDFLTKNDQINVKGDRDKNLESYLIKMYLTKTVSRLDAPVQDVTIYVV